MFVCMHLCMQIYMYVCTYVCMYVCKNGSTVRMFIGSGACKNDTYH